MSPDRNAPDFGFGTGTAMGSGANPTPQNPIEDLYKTELGRAPDAGGLAYWTNAYNTGTSVADIQNAFRGSEEYQNIQRGTGIPENVLVNPRPMDSYPAVDRGYGVAMQPSLDPTKPYEPPKGADPFFQNLPLEREFDPVYFDFDGKPTRGYQPGYTTQLPVKPESPYERETNPRRRNIPIDSRQLFDGSTGEYYYAGNPRFSQVDPVMDFVQNIDQQLPYLQRAFQEQLQLLGDPAAAARAVLGSLR